MNLTNELKQLQSDVDHINDPDKNYFRLVFADLMELIKRRKNPETKELLIKSGFLDSAAHFPQATRRFYRLLLEACRDGTSFPEGRVQFFRDYLQSRAEQSKRAFAT